MTRHSSKFAALCLASPEDDTLWRGIFATQGLHAISVSPGKGGLEALAADSRLLDCTALVADAPAMLAHGIAPGNLAQALRHRFPGLAIFVRLPGRVGISGPEQAWARGSGISSLLPGSTVAAWQDSIAPVLARVLEGVGGGEPDLAPLRTYLDSLVKKGVEPRPGVVNDIHADAYRLERAGLHSSQVFERMQEASAVAVSDRTYRGRTYRECFVASEAVDWVESAFHVERTVATRLCRFLWRTGRIHHVLRDAEFADAFLFFRFGARRADVERIDLRSVETGMREGGIPIGDRTYLGKTYSNCFVGAQACEWLSGTHRLTLGAAETVGHWLLELGVLHHVLDAHGFVGGNYFYRFRADEKALASG